MKQEANKHAVHSWRLYAPGPFGQLHFTAARPLLASGSRPLLCLHSTPLSGVEFEAFQRAMAADRLTICADTPGFGGSDRPPGAPALQDYAAAIFAALQASGLVPPGAAFDILGLHTGAVLATELALSQPAAVHAVVLSGLPLLSAAEREHMMSRYVKPVPLLTDPEFVAREFRTAVLEERPIAQTRRLALFIERLRAGADAWWAARAVFGYPLAESLRAVSQPAMVLVVPDSLAAQSRLAMDLLRSGTLVDVEAKTTADVWELQPDLLASLVREFLDRPD